MSLAAPTQEEFIKVPCDRRFKIVINDSDSFEWYGPNLLTVLCMLYDLYPDFSFDVEELPF